MHKGILGSAPLSLQCHVKLANRSTSFISSAPIDLFFLSYALVILGRSRRSFVEMYLKGLTTMASPPPTSAWYTRGLSLLAHGSIFVPQTVVCK